MGDLRGVAGFRGGADLKVLFRYLAFGLAVILVFIGSKMLLTSIDVHIPIGLSLGIIATVLAVIASLAIAPISKGEAALAEEG
jgi:predicted tellurium resistance membrane protein TerC